MTHKIDIFVFNQKSTKKTERRNFFLRALFCISFIFNLLSHNIFAQNQLTNSTDDIEIAVFEDENNQLTFDDILSGKYDAFFQNSKVKNRIYLGILGNRHWIKIQVKKADSSEKKVLCLFEAKLKEANLYFQKANGQWDKIQNGYDIPVEKKYKENHFNIFPLPDSLQNKIFYLSVAGSPRLAMDLVILSEKKFDSGQNYTNIIYGVFYGLLIFIIFNNISLAILTRTGMYVMYVGCACLYLFDSLFSSGYSTYLFNFDNVIGFHLVSTLGLGFMAVYAIVFLGLKKGSKLYQILLYFIITDILVASLVFVMPTIWALIVMQVLAGCQFFSFVYVGYATYRTGKNYAFYYFLAFAFFTFFVILEIIELNFGILGYFLISHVEWGWTSEVLILAYSLNLKIDSEKRQLQAQNEAIQAENIKIVKEQNLVLEQKISERTIELIDAFSELQAAEEELKQNLEEIETTQELLSVQKNILEEQNEFQKAILDNAATMIISVTSDGLITSFNPAAELILGYTKEELILKKTPAIFHDIHELQQRAEQLREQFGTTVEVGFQVFIFKTLKGLPNKDEWTYVKKNGEKITVSLSISALWKGDDLLGFLGMAEDITDKKNYELKIKKQNDELLLTQEKLTQNLEELNNVYREIENEQILLLRTFGELNAITDALDKSALVSITDTQGNILKVNDIFCQISGYTEEELLGQNHRVVNSGVHSKEFWAELWKTIAQGRTWRGEVCNRAKDGSFYWVDAVITPIYNENNKIYQFLSVRALITERKKTEELVKSQHLELQKNYEEVNQLRQVAESALRKTELQHQDIISSIRYARRIQLSLLPKKAFVNHFLNDFFAFYQPRDIVSGDFYWFSAVGKKIILAVADCTGHGVPGAFMTMLGVNLLHQIVNREKNAQPEKILTELDARLTGTLQNGIDANDVVNDGMDIALTVFDTETNVLLFGAAKRPMWLFRAESGILEEYKGDKFPIGSSQFKSKSFTQKEILLQKGDVFYLFTDGYADQFKADEKYRIGRFRNLLQTIWQKDFEEQHWIIDEEFKAWKGNFPQTDDVLITGVRVSGLQPKDF